MRFGTIFRAAMLAAAPLAIQAGPVEPARHEIGLTLGRLAANERGVVTAGAGTALQANYGGRLWNAGQWALFAEVHLLASPQRKVTGPAAASRDFASLYVTPGLRIKFAAGGRFQPYAAIGAGYANYEHSTLTIGGAPNPAPRHTSHTVAAFGGGIDIPIRRWIGARLEVRDFYTPSPRYNAGPAGRQHNVVAGGGLVLRWGSD